MFTHVRRTNLFTFMFVALFTVLSLFLFWYVLPTRALNDAVFGPTRGLVNATLIFTVLETCFLLIFVRVAGGLRPRDLGLASSLPRALLFTALLWVLTQIGVAFWQFGTAGQVSWNSAWRDPGATFMLGELVEQLFGNAFYEETAFRGFVFVQTYLFMRHRKTRSPLVTALLTSQLFFALLHIPLQLLDRDSSWAELPFWILATGVAGIIFAILYVKTQNLFIAAGFHALFNEPTQLFAPPVEPSQIPTTIVTLLGLALVFWPVTGRLWRESAQPLPEPIPAQR